LTSLAKQQAGGKKQMKKLLLIALMISGFGFVPVQRSDAQIFGVRALSFGFPGGYYAYYPTYYNYYPYGYYMRPYVSILNNTRIITGVAHTTGITDIEFTTATTIITTIKKYRRNRSGVRFGTPFRVGRAQ
jgi:hypothetical protein